MPAKSEAQRRKLYATFGAAWVKKHGFDNKGKLPARVRPKVKKKAKSKKRKEPDADDKKRRKLPKRGQRTVTNRKTGKKRKTKY
jgi:ribosomal protein S13